MKTSVFLTGCQLLITVLLSLSCVSDAARKNQQRQISTTPQQQTVTKPSFTSISRLSNLFLKEIYTAVGPTHNILICPLSIWSTMVMLTEAAAGETEEELLTFLKTKPKEALQHYYSQVFGPLKSINGPMTQLVLANFMAQGKNKTVNKDFARKMNDVYESKVFNLDKNDVAKMGKTINDWGAQITQNRITKIVDEDDLKDVEFLIGSGAFFKGKWKNPFNISATYIDEFKNEDDSILGGIPMMSQRTVLPYAYSSKLEAQIVEIPYAGDEMSMIVILPRRKVKMAEVLAKMQNLRVSEMLSEPLIEDEVELDLPKFTLSTEYALNSVFFKEGVKRVFSPADAELPQLSNGVYVTKISHKSEIENSEEGTVSSSVTVAIISNRQPIARFHANRPFIYLIIDAKNRIPTFAGVFNNPLDQR